MVAWKTILIVIAALILLVVILIFIFGVMEEFKPMLDKLIERLDEVVSTIFDLAEWPW